MQCPKCQAELESRPPHPSPSTDASAETGQTSNASDRRASKTAEEALRADAPPGPCPRCGWSTMWNE
jgi:hypothetical protein